MKRSIDIYKDIPLKVILKKDLREIGMSLTDLALLIDVSYSTLYRSLNNRRKFSPKESRKIDKLLNYEHNFTQSLQAYQIALHVETTDKFSSIPPIPKIRKCVFWDTDLNSLNWITHRKFIVNRIGRYGSIEEQHAVAQFYSNLR